MRVIFCLPGRTFSDKFLKSWTALLAELGDRDISFVVSQAYDSVVYYVRNKCLGGNLLAGPSQKPFGGKVEYDYMMWIDSDIVFKPEDFFKLLEHKKDVVSGMYMMQDRKHFTTVQHWDTKFFKKNGHFPFLTEKDIKRKKQLIPVAYTGFGWMLVKNGVFESLDYPWFRPLWKEFPFDPPVREFTSEDVAACHLIKKNGFTIHVDPTVRVGHEKMIIV